MIGQRVKDVRNFLKLNQSDFAKELDTTTVSISRYENDDRQLPAEILEKISGKFNISGDWLLTGRGEMYYHSNGKPAAQDGNEACDVADIPILGLKASAGYGHENFTVEPIGVFKLSKTILAGMNMANLNNIQVTGDSMSPTLEDGDWITFSAGMIAGNGIYVLNNMGELYIKRLQFKMDGTIEVISDNQKYSTEKLKRDELIIVGKCLLRLGKLI